MPAVPLPLRRAKARRRPDRPARSRRSLLPRRRCGGSRPRPGCRTCSALRNGTARCAHCPATSVAPAPHRATGPSGPALVSARPTPAATRRGVVLDRARRLLRSLLPPGAREPAFLLWHYTTQLIILRRRFYVAPTRKEAPCMAKKRGEPRKYSIPTSFEQARDELFSHILRCGVLEATPEHQKEWFDDTLLYLADRFTDLTESEMNELRVLGERYCRPVVARTAPVAANV